MMPTIQAALQIFEETIQFQLVTKTVVDGELAETSTVKPVLWFEGVLIPIHPRELLVKPEGQRKFKWWTLFSDLDLKVDTIIKDQEGALYRIMNSTDWRDADYKQYQLIEGPGV